MTSHDDRIGHVSRTAVRFLMVSAVLAATACGTTGTLSGTSEPGGPARVIRDPQNPNWVGSSGSNAVIDPAADPRGRGPR